MKDRKYQPFTVRGEFKRAMHEGLRIYFAPFVGAIRGVRAELRRVEQTRDQLRAHR